MVSFMSKHPQGLLFRCTLLSNCMEFGLTPPSKRHERCQGPEQSPNAAISWEASHGQNMLLPKRE